MKVNKKKIFQIVSKNVKIPLSNIGEDSSNILISNGVSDFSIGNACDGIYISGTVSKIKIGDFNENIIARASGNLTIGNQNSDIFLESSNVTKIGDYNSNIALADVGLTAKNLDHQLLPLDYKQCHKAHTRY